MERKNDDPEMIATQPSENTRLQGNPNELDDLDDVPCAFARLQPYLPARCTPKLCKNILIFAMAATILIVVITVAVTLATTVSTISPTPRRALIVGISGLKASILSEALRRGLTPNIASIVTANASRICANSSLLSCATTHDGNRFGSRPPSRHMDYYSPFLWESAPGWASILSGVTNAKHKVANDSLRAWNGFPPEFPSIVSTAWRYGLRVGALGGPGLLGADGAEGILDREKFELSHKFPSSKDDDGDAKACMDVCDNVYHGYLDLMILNLGAVDDAGHKYGWGSTEQINQLAKTDGSIGMVFDWIRDDHAEWLVILTADHGGIGFSHGVNWIEDEAVPFIAAILGNSKNRVGAFVDPVRHFDAAPTVLKWFGIPLEQALDGRAQGI